MEQIRELKEANKVSEVSAEAQKKFEVEKEGILQKHTSAFEAQAMKNDEEEKKKLFKSTTMSLEY